MLRKTGTAEPSFGAGDLPNCGGAHAAGGGARRRWLAQAVVHSTNLATLTNEVLCIEYNDR